MVPSPAHRGGRGRGLVAVGERDLSQPSPLRPPAGEAGRRGNKKTNLLCKVGFKILSMTINLSY